MGKIRLFRLTLATDTSSTEFIDFNLGTALADRTDIENPFIKTIEQKPSDGVGTNQGAELPLGDQQALGPVEDIYILDGFISKRNGDANDGMNAFLQTLKLWENDPKKVKGVWELGRFPQPASKFRSWREEMGHGFLQKPYKSDTLLRTLHELLR